MPISSEGVIVKSIEYLGYEVFASGVVVPVGVSCAPFDSGRGYLVVRVKLAGKHTTKAVHRLVAECWVPNPNNRLEVNHKDGDKRNNAASNLEWVSRSENIKHAYSNKLRSASGVLNSRCKCSEDTVVAICSHLQSGLSNTEIRDLGYDYGLVRQIRCRKSWKHISERFSW